MVGYQMRNSIGTVGLDVIEQVQLGWRLADSYDLLFVAKPD